MYQEIEHVETTVTGEISLLVVSDYDVITARQKGKWFAEQIGFSGSMPTLLSALVSELARNLLMSVKRGKVIIQSVQFGIKKGITVIASENGQNGQGPAWIKREVRSTLSGKTEVLAAAPHNSAVNLTDAKVEQRAGISSVRGEGKHVISRYSKSATSNVCKMLIARRDLADEVEIIPAVNGSTTVRVTKWL